MEGMGGAERLNLIKVGVLSPESSQSRGFSAPPACSQRERGLLTLLCVEVQRWETPSLKPAPLDSSGVTSNQLCPRAIPRGGPEGARVMGRAGRWAPRPE